jgi:predicted RNase H-like nuclease (RuvC/YqgF family)
LYDFKLTNKCLLEINKKLEDKNDALNKKDRELKDFETKYTFENATLKTNLEDLNAQIESKDNQIAQLELSTQQLSSKKSNSEEFQKKISDLEQKLKDKEDTLEALGHEFTVLKRANEQQIQVEQHKQSLIQEDLATSKKDFEDLNKN